MLLLIIVGVFLTALGIVTMADWHASSGGDYESVAMYRFWVTLELLVGISLILRGVTLP